MAAGDMSELETMARVRDDLPTGSVEPDESIPPVPSKKRRVQLSPEAQSSATRLTRGPRPSQRAPKSCLECTRRKIRCDKEQPCGPCTERGAADECRREAVFVKGAVMGGELSRKALTLESLAKDVMELRQRIVWLETGRETAVTPPMRPGPGSQVERSKLPGTMEEFALGIGESTRWQGASLLQNKDEGTSSATQWYQPHSLGSSLSALPSRSNANLLVAFYLDEVSWITSAIHGQTFLTKHQAFWERLEKNECGDDLWLGLLFAVLSVAALFMDDNEAALRGLSAQYLKLAGNAWFDSAIAVLYRLGIWIQPSLLTCQILQVLGPAFHLTGNTSLHQTMTSIGITHMRSINLHLLGSHENDDWQESISKDIGRRIWWNSVEADWIFLPYNGYAQFIPHQFTTHMPGMIDESTPICDGSTAKHYRTACYRSARFIYDVYGHLGVGEDPSYDRVLRASTALDDLVATLPRELQYDRQRASSFPLSAVQATRQRFLALVLAYRLYQIHRMFYVRSLSDSQFAPTRTACLKAADAITSVTDSGLPPTYLRLWNVTVSLVVAGIILAIQLLETARSRQVSFGTQRERVQALVKRLETSQDNSGIAGRGAIFIAYLLRVEEEIWAGERTEVEFTRQSMMALVQTGLQMTQSRTLPEPGPTPSSPTANQSATQSRSIVDSATLAAPEWSGMALYSDGEIDFAALLNDLIGGM